MDTLQEFGILDSNTADHSLGEWLQENNLTDDDLNTFKAPQANDSEMSALIDCYRRMFEYDPREATVELAYVRTEGGRKDLVLQYTQAFEEAFAEVEALEDDD